ncbi:S1 RNA-binding domain-containing protein, partial [Spongiibacter tropicus]|uniref:S1 RNA-binding domain-containing protein n=1 Tax=Spongiibacter tropicus TaxID=454602 RepID=UPI0035BEA2F5
RLALDRYPVGSIVMGRVRNITDFGVFIGLDEGIDGLVHISDISWSQRLCKPSELAKKGEEIEVKVLNIDVSQERLSLGVKQLIGDPWKDLDEKYPIRSEVTGTIVNITDFGIFIGLDGNIDGLVHLSDISWNESGEDAVRKFKKGDEIETVILSIDPERERISLGIKQLEEDPFSDYVAVNDRGSIVTGVVKEVDAKAAIITLADEVEGVLKASEISRDRVEDARNVLKEGEEVEVKVISVDRKNRSLSLSIKAKDMEDEKEAVKALREKESEAAAPATIGDLIKAQMENKD